MALASGSNSPLGCLFVRLVDRMVGWRTATGQNQPIPPTVLPTVTHPKRICAPTYLRLPLHLHGLGVHRRRSLHLLLKLLPRHALGQPTHEHGEHGLLVLHADALAPRLVVLEGLGRLLRVPKARHLVGSFYGVGLIVTPNLRWLIRSKVGHMHKVPHVYICTYLEGGEERQRLFVSPVALALPLRLALVLGVEHNVVGLKGPEERVHVPRS